MSLVDTLGSASCIWNASIACESQVLGMTGLLLFGSWPRLELKSIKPNDAIRKLKQIVFNNGRRLRAVGCALLFSVVFRTFALSVRSSRCPSARLSLPFERLPFAIDLFQGVKTASTTQAATTMAHVNNRNSLVRIKTNCREFNQPS